MTLGPFNIREHEHIKMILESKGVPFGVYLDQELEEQLLKNFHQGATISPRSSAGRLDLKTLFFEIQDEDFFKVQLELEKFGIVAPSDGSWELSEDSE